MNNKNKIKALAAVWDLSQGRHPNVATRPNLYRADPFKQRDAYTKYDLGLTFDHCGHNVFKDNGYANLVATNSEVPISPLFVRDLTGKVIYIGYGPEFKTKYQWQANPQYTFPYNCREITADVEGYEELENVFLTHFRAMDMTLEPSCHPVGNTEQYAAGFYPMANLHPYKLRVDSFYIDGWKIPQTELVFARTVGIHPESAKDAARDFIRSWDSRQEGQSYVEFHKAVGGATYFKELFNKGCTVIPAMGAKNGIRKVGHNFENLGNWPGRAIDGLHEIAEHKDSDAPEGTILEILRPGFVAGDQVESAVVNVSNGSNYIDPNQDDSAPHIPDLFLPHTRSSSSWGRTWIPTKPKHFDEPSIWGWDDQKGHFIQQKGPLWDPLHYYYSSVPKIIDIYDKQKNGDDMVPVPEDMKKVFHPAIKMRCFDTFSRATAVRRADHNSLIKSSIHSVKSENVICGLGYHPLPVQFEYELDTFWAPELSPRTRIAQDAPNNVANRVLPVIEAMVPLDDYIKSIDTPDDAIWFKAENMVRASSFDGLIDYPYISRYLGKVPEDSIYELAPVFLEDLPLSVLNSSIQDKWGSMDISDDLDPLCPGFYDAFYSLQEKAKKRRINRYEFYKSDRNGYILKWWQSVKWPEGDYVEGDAEKDVIWTSVITPPTV
jgi:hypothetical protein